MDEKALYKITYGMYVLTAQADGQSSGCVVNTLQQVTAEPVRLAVTVNKENLTCELMEKSGHFAAVALDQRTDMMLIGRFGFRSGRDFAKFEGIEAGMPYPLQAVCAHYSCKIEQTLDLGTHMMFVGVAEESEILSEEEPLTYSYYRNVIKGKTPKSAPSYQAGH